MHGTIIELMDVSNQVITFPKPQEALEYIKKNNPEDAMPAGSIDLIFLDLNMPVMNGFQFLDEYKKLHEIDKSRFVIYMVASSTNQEIIDNAAAYHEVLSGLIEKPLDEEKIEELINNL